MTNQCGDCARMRTLLERLRSMLVARDVVVFTQEIGFIEAELEGRNGAIEPNGYCPVCGDKVCGEALAEHLAERHDVNRTCEP